MSERIQKLLAGAGFGSRRALERVIAEGGILVNGTGATLGDRVEAGDRIQVKGRQYRVLQGEAVAARVLAYHKPEGEVCTRTDPQNRPTVFANLPRSRSRWVSVGRLDINTSGLLLFTDDGEMAHRLMHPSMEVERRYAVRIFGGVDDTVFARLLAGVELEDGPARFSRIEDAGGSGSNHWYHVALREGRNHEVRRLWAAVGTTVSRLIRIGYGPIDLDPRLRPGRARPLEFEELKALRALTGDTTAAQPPLVLRESSPARRGGTQRRRR